jgi:ParB family transcriptional regulator, chromosome partitioning protein
MNAIIRPSRSAWLTFEQIDLPDNGRPYNATEVVALASSIRAIGLLTPLTVVERDGRYLLVTGRHRLEALRLVEADKVPVRIVDFDDIEARLWTISENLHRAELTVRQRADHIAEWIKLTEAKEANASQVETHKKGQQPGGVNAAARELGIGKAEAHRAVKIASITPEAKEAAREAGLDNNQSALLKVASYADEDQVEAVEIIVQSRAQQRR